MPAPAAPPVPPKRRYVTPALTLHGDVRALTGQLGLPSDPYAVVASLLPPSGGLGLMRL